METELTVDADALTGANQRTFFIEGKEKCKLFGFGFFEAFKMKMNKSGLSGLDLMTVRCLPLKTLSQALWSMNKQPFKTTLACGCV